MRTASALRALAAALPVAVTLLAAPATASAAPSLAGPAAINGVDGVFTGNGVYIRGCPHTNCKALGEGFAGQSECVTATATGDTVSGNNQWADFPYTEDVAGFSSLVYMTVNYGESCSVV